MGIKNQLASPNCCCLPTRATYLIAVVGVGQPHAYFRSLNATTDIPAAYPPITYHSYIHTRTHIPPSKGKSSYGFLTGTRLEIQWEGLILYGGYISG